MLMLSFTSAGASFSASFSVSEGTVSFLMAMLGSPLNRFSATSQTISPGRHVHPEHPVGRAGHRKRRDHAIKGHGFHLLDPRIQGDLANPARPITLTK